MSAGVGELGYSAAVEQVEPPDMPVIRHVGLGAPTSLLLLRERRYGETVNVWSRLEGLTLGATDRVSSG